MRHTLRSTIIAFMGVCLVTSLVTFTVTGHVRKGWEERLTAKRFCTPCVSSLCSSPSWSHVGSRSWSLVRSQSSSAPAVKRLIEIFQSTLFTIIKSITETESNSPLSYSEPERAKVTIGAPSEEHGEKHGENSEEHGEENREKHGENSEKHGDENGENSEKHGEENSEKHREESSAESRDNAYSEISNKLIGAISDPHFHQT